MERHPLIGHDYDELDDGVNITINEKGQTTLVDVEDVEFVLTTRWSIDSKGYVARGYRKNGKYKKAYLHRELLKWHEWKIPKGQHVDHINHVKTDNRKGNLRVVTRSQNQANRRRKKDGFKGVTFNSRTGLYEARIQLESKMMYLGSFSNDRMAAHYYNLAAKQIHGDYAELNDIEGLRPKTGDN